MRGSHRRRIMHKSRCADCHAFSNDMHPDPSLNRISAMHAPNSLTDLSCDTGATTASLMSRLLVMDDSPDWGDFVSTVAEELGLEATAVTRYRQFVDAYQARPADILVLDLFMPEKDGIEIILDIAKLDARPFIILMSGQSSNFLDMASKLGQAKGLDIIGTLGKPFRLGELREMLQKAANLVDRKKKHSRGISNSCLSRTLTWETGGKRTDKSLALSRDRRRRRNIAKAANTGRTVKQDIKDINTQFCLALWKTQLAALDALCTIPGAMIEAIANLATPTAELPETESWKKALGVHLHTLRDSRTVIRESAAVHRLPELGRSAVELINRVDALLNELMTASAAESSYGAEKLAGDRALVDEIGKLDRTLLALAASLKEAIATAGDGFHRTETEASSRSGNEGKESTVVDFPKSK